MKPIITTALALVMTAAAVPAVAQYGMSSAPPASPSTPQNQPAAAGAQQQTIKPSAKALKAVMDLQDAVTKNDVASIPAKIAAAEAVAQTKEDRYLIASLQLKAAAAAKDKAAVAAAIDAIAASNALDPAHLSNFYVALAGSYYNDKEYTQAIATYQKALSIDPQNAEAANMVGEAMLGAGQKAEAAATFQRLLQGRAAAGQKPEENLYKKAVAIAYDAKSPAATDLALAWVAAYPAPSSWSDAIAIYRNLNLGDDETNIDLLRLKQAMGIMTGGEYAQLAVKASNQLVFGEARAAVDAGIAANKIDPASPDYRDLVAAARARAKPTPADLATAMKAAANGKALMRIGDNYAAISDYSNAVQAYKLAMARPDGDAAVANLHIGIALAQAGDKAGATAAFKSVTGARAEIAKYWLTYLAQKA
jgi:tetratricopeptide (TPR) repeat protein